MHNVFMFEFLNNNNVITQCCALTIELQRVELIQKILSVLAY